MRRIEPDIALSEPSADEIKTTTCYMCACRCGIRVHLKDGKVRYIDGNRDHPVNKGVICGKGASGIMKHTSPSRLRAPLKRVGPRGSGEFAEISWDEALATATGWLRDVRERDPSKLAFFTGRDQSQALTGWFAQQYGTQNFAAHGGFCSVNMAAAGLYTFGGSFWEFGEPDWEHTRYFMLFGVAEDHASNPIKMALGKLKAKGVKFVAVNPVRTGYGAIADEWIGIRPGTDGLFVGSLIHELMRAEKIDLDYLVRYTNAPWLVIQDPASPDDGLFARDREGKPLAFDRTTGGIVDATRADISPALTGEFQLPDGRTARPAFALIAERYLADSFTPEADRRDNRRVRRRPSGASRASWRTPRSSSRSRSTFPGPTAPAAGTTRPSAARSRCTPCAASPRIRTASRPAGCCICCRSCSARSIAPAASATRRRFRGRRRQPTARPGRRSRARRSPARRSASRKARRICWSTRDGKAQRIDKAYSWDAPLAAHGLMHMVITNAANADPYPVDVLFLYMANMSWNSSMNIPAVLQHLTAKDPGDRRIPHSEDHLFRRLFVGDGGLCRPDPARHDLSRTLGLHLAARPADLQRRRPGRRDPAAGGRARPRRARLPERAARSRRAARPAGLRHTTTARRAIPAATPTTSSITSARPASDRSPAFAAPMARAMAAARPTPSSSSPTSRAAASTIIGSRRSSAITSTPTGPISTGRSESGFIGDAEADRVPALSRDAAEIPPRRARPRRDRAARRRIAHASRQYFDPIPFWYAAVRECRLTRRRVIRSRPSRSGRCTSITRGARTMRGCARSPRRTVST